MNYKYMSMHAIKYIAHSDFVKAWHTHVLSHDL